MTNNTFKQTEIGEIPEDWNISKLSNYATIEMGQSPKSEYYNNEGNGMPFLQGVRTFGEIYPSFDTWCSKPNKIAEKGDVLLSVRAPVGEVNIASEKLCIGRGVSAVRGKHNRFTYYLLKSAKARIDSRGTGTVYRSINKADIENLLFAFPSENEQQQISSILSSLDDKIELNRRMNKTLEEIGKALFKHWFVDFEFPNENGEPYKSSGGEMVESELGEIPKGWKVKTLDEVADVSIGRTPPRLQKEWFSTNPEDIKWISIKDMGNSGMYIQETAEYLTREAVQNFNIPTIPTNTVIVSFKLTVGRVAITTEEMLSNEAIAHIKTNFNKLSAEYMYLLLKKFDFSSLGTTSSIATAVNSKSIKGIELLIPNYEMLDNFNLLVKPIFRRILTNSLEISNLEILRDSLLPRLMSGKIRV